jgi:DUF1680 family protein
MNCRKLFSHGAAGLLPFVMAAPLLGAPRIVATAHNTKDYVVANQASPHVQSTSTPLTAVRFTRGFWAEELKQTQSVTARRLWELLADPEIGHVLENFRIAAGETKGDFAGVPWQDEWLYKWLEGAACLNRVAGDGWLAARMEEAIPLIVRAQQPDGYISTQITIPGKQRFQDTHEHEAYNMGHLITAGVIHRRMTGRDDLFVIARKTADYLCATLGVSVEPYFAHNPSVLMGLMELYRDTGDQKYLACAQRIVDARGAKPKRGGRSKMEPGINGTDVIQDRVPLRKSTEVVGHNVFFTYLYTGAADIYLETGEAALLQALQRLWLDLTGRKTYINGGVSAIVNGLSHGYPVGEAAGPPYFLPNADAHNEICGQIGSLMWNYRMLCASGDAAYADQMELALYNGILSGIGLDGRSWFYRNPLRRYEKNYQPKGGTDMAQRGEPGRSEICCPSNLLRMLAEWQSYLYTVGDDAVWVHHYAANEFTHAWPDGLRLRCEMTTDYPWDGRVTIEVGEAPPWSLSLNLRIPGWAESAVLRVNGEPHAVPLTPSTYAQVKRIWKTGDRLELDLPMPVRLMEAHPKAEAQRNQVAVMRGPVLYCLESPDLPETIDISDVYLEAGVHLEPVAAKDLPFGILTLTGEGLRRPDQPLTERPLYRPLNQTPFTRLPVRLIPYFAWANRGPSAMTVWLPVVFAVPSAKP